MRDSKSRTQVRKEKKARHAVRRFTLELIEDPSAPIHGGVRELKVGAYMMEEYEGKITCVPLSKESAAHVTGGFLIDMLATYAEKMDGALKLVPANSAEIKLADDKVNAIVKPIEGASDESTDELG